jgi:hypothetical protein
MLTAWCLLVAFLTPWVVGAPVLWVLRGGRAIQRPDWLWTPFIGLAALVCVLQNLAVYADRPLHLTVPWVWAVVACGWVLLLLTPGGRASVRTVPVRILALAAVVYLIQAVGVITSGVDRYRGNLVSDQYNYVLGTQFMMEERFSTEWSDVGQRPWLLLPVTLKTDRLGQYVIQGFFAESIGSDALHLFFPTIYLGAALVVPALRLLAPRVGLFGWRASSAAALGGLVPGLTAITIDCYMSHALFTPILFAFLAALLRATRRWSALVPAVLTFVLGYSVYTEFAPLLVGVGAVALGAGWLWCGIGWKRVLVVGACLATAPLLDPAVVKTFSTILARTKDQGLHMGANMTWGYMAAHAWLDRLRSSEDLSTPTAAVRFCFVAGCYALALAGWFRAGLLGYRYRRTLSGVAAVGALVLLLLVGLCAGARYPVYKTLATSAPLLVLGIALWARPGRTTPTLKPGAPENPGGALSVGGWGQRLAPKKWILSALAAWFIFLTVSQPAVRKIRVYTQARDAWNEPDLLALTDSLRAQPPSDVVVMLGDGGNSWVISGALFYHGRHHRMWVASPKKMWFDELGRFPAPQLSADTSALKPGALVVADETLLARAGVSGEVVQRSTHYVLVRVNAGSGHPPGGQ